MIYQINSLNYMLILWTFANYAQEAISLKPILNTEENTIYWMVIRLQSIIYNLLNIYGYLDICIYILLSWKFKKVPVWQSKNFVCNMRLMMTKVFDNFLCYDAIDNFCITYPIKDYLDLQISYKILYFFNLRYYNFPVCTV